MQGRKLTEKEAHYLEQWLKANVINWCPFEYIDRNCDEEDGYFCAEFYPELDDCPCEFWSREEVIERARELLGRSG